MFSTLETMGHVMFVVLAVIITIMFATVYRQEQRKDNYIIADAIPHTLGAVDR